MSRVYSLTRIRFKLQNTSDLLSSQGTCSLTRDRFMSRIRSLTRLRFMSRIHSLTRVRFKSHVAFSLAFFYLQTSVFFLLPVAQSCVTILT